MSRQISVETFGISAIGVAAALAAALHFAWLPSRQGYDFEPARAYLFTIPPMFPECLWYTVHSGETFADFRFEQAVVLDLRHVHDVTIDHVDWLSPGQSFCQFGGEPPK